jgi:catalase
MHSEATHMFMWAMSDRAIPRSYRMMQGFGVNTFTLVNAQGQRSFVKFHLTPELGVHSLVWDEALKIAGQDPDFHRKDLWEAIDAGTFPKWKFGIQVLPESREHEFDFDVLDATKIWPEELVPIRYIGELELNRNVDEYFPQTEQVAFCTSHIVPGIGFSDDPLLQGRNFSYFDTQLSRLGTNWEELPINRAVCPVMNFNRDGAMRHTISKGTVNYWPNRRQTMPPASHQEGGYIDYAERVQGVKARAKGKKFKDHFSQARLFLNSLSPIEKKHVQAALGFELDHCDDRVVYDRVAYERLAQIDISLAKAVAELVGAKVPESAETTNTGKKSKGLSQLEYLPKDPIIASRKVAIIVADGYDALAFEAIVDALKGGKAIPVVIGTKRSQISPAGQSNPVTPDHHLEGMRSTLFDAVFVPGGEKSVATLSKNGRAMHWIREAFGHLKAIGATGEAVDLVRHAVQLDGVKVSENHDVCVSYGVVTLQSVRPEHLSEALDVVKDGNGFVSKFVTAISSHRCWDREMDGLSDMVAF